MQQFKHWLNEDVDLYIPQLLTRLKQLPTVGSLYIHFTKINKVGVKPLTFHADPVGVYAFPADYVLSLAVRKNPLFFAMNYAFILEKNPEAKVLDLSKITNDDVAKWIPNYKSMSVFIPGGSPGSKFWYGLHEQGSKLHHAREKLGMYKSSFIRNLGYDVVVDHDGIIHSQEPQQIIFLTPHSYKVIDVVTNSTLPNKAKNFARITLEKLATILLDNYHINFSTSGYRHNLRATGKKDGKPYKLSLAYSNDSHEFSGEVNFSSERSQEYKTMRISFDHSTSQEIIDAKIKIIAQEFQQIFNAQELKDESESVRTTISQILNLLSFKSEATDGFNNSHFTKHYSYGTLIINLSFRKDEYHFGFTFKGKTVPNLYASINSEKADAAELLESALNKWQEAITMHYNPKTSDDYDYHQWENARKGEQLTKILNFFRNKMSQRV